MSVKLANFRHFLSSIESLLNINLDLDVVS